MIDDFGVTGFGVLFCAGLLFCTGGLYTGLFTTDTLLLPDKLIVPPVSFVILPDYLKLIVPVFVGVQVVV